MMNKRIVFVLLSILLVILLVGGVFLYNELYEDYTDSNGIYVVEDDKESKKENTFPDDEESQNVKNNDEQTEDDDENAAPDVEIFDADGKPVMLSSFFDKPVVLNFWATWCGPCKSEMPGFDRLYGEYKDKVNFVMLNVSDDRKTVQEFLKENNYSFPIYYDDTQIAAYTYGASSIPLTFVIHEGGKVYGYQIGVLPEDALEKAIKAVLKED